MATVYSGTYSTGTNTYTRVKVDYSGNSATATLLYTRTNDYAYSTGQTGTFSFGGASVSYSKFFTGRQTDAVVASVSFSISTSGGYYSGSSTSSSSYTYLNFSGGVTIPAQTTGSISTPTISNIQRYPYSISATLSCANLGGGTGSKELSLEVWPTATIQSGQPHRFAQLYTTNNSLTATYTVDNQSSVVSSGFTFRPNKVYYVVGYARNDTASNSPLRSGYQAVSTTPLAPTFTLVSVTDKTATFSWTQGADAGENGKYVKYSIDDGAYSVAETWSAGDGSAKSGTVTITGLSSETTYTLNNKAELTTGTYLSGTAVSFTTLPGGKIYGSVNGQTKQVQKLYGSVNGAAKEIKKMYGSVNGVAKRVY